MIKVNDLKEIIKVLEGTVDELEMYEGYDDKDNKGRLDSLEQIERNLVVMDSKFAKSKTDIAHFMYTERLKCK